MRPKSASTSTGFTDRSQLTCRSWRTSYDGCLPPDRVPIAPFNLRRLRPSPTCIPCDDEGVM